MQRQRLPVIQRFASSSLGAGVRVEQCARRDELPRCADAALQPAALEEALLDRVQPLVVSEPLHGDDLGAVGLRGKREARRHHASIEEHRARAAHAHAARLLRAGQAEVGAQQLDQESSGRGVYLSGFAVHGQPHGAPADPARAAAGRLVAQRAVDLLRREWEVRDTHADRVRDGVGDRRRHRHVRRLADALDGVRADPRRPTR